LVVNETRYAGSIDDVEIPFGCTEAFCDPFGIGVLKDGQTGSGCEIGKAFLKSGQVDD
jgi:hypothetical protein